MISISISLAPPFDILVPNKNSVSGQWGVGGVGGGGGVALLYKILFGSANLKKIVRIVAEKGS
jgi:hypothetical protein